MSNSVTAQHISVLGLGAMGAALAQALLAGGHQLTVWNRTPSRAEALVSQGAQVAATSAEALAVADLVILCLLDDASVREHLEPAAAALRGRTVINLTTATPEQARSLGRWAAEHEVALMDGGIMAVPSMIGGPAAFVLYSGAAAEFERFHGVLELFGRAEFVGEDFGAAAMYDLAILGGMYSMFAGFQQGAKMVRTTGGTAAHLATLMAPFLQAMTTMFAQYAPGIDDPESYVPEQDADFTAGAIGTIDKAAVESGTATELFGVLLRTLPGI
ncbi:6-phosphogluconate dehydrogenase [Nocardia mangyaensis]|uniref:6-phosphogluconate dehydrogenase n=1 Tax=Nocardia mangyaensis TaxID=2213200 RepID=A0A1J0VNR3_9NOCA|nr:6-phosphogluconate dehydrogenase [Nocardia mangyaensis]